MCCHRRQQGRSSLSSGFLYWLLGSGSLSLPLLLLQFLNCVSKPEKSSEQDRGQRARLYPTYRSWAAQPPTLALPRYIQRWCSSPCRPGSRWICPSGFERTRCTRRPTGIGQRLPADLLGRRSRCQGRRLSLACRSPTILQACHRWKRGHRSSRGRSAGERYGWERSLWKGLRLLWQRGGGLGR